MLQNPRRISSLLLARRFSHHAAQRLVTAVAEDRRNQTPRFSLSLSLKLLLSPSMSF